MNPGGEESPLILKSKLTVVTWHAKSSSKDGTAGLAYKCGTSLVRHQSDGGPKSLLSVFSWGLASVVSCNSGSSLKLAEQPPVATKFAETSHDVCTYEREWPKWSFGMCGR